jgi:hypothetical protein
LKNFPYTALRSDLKDVSIFVIRKWIFTLIMRPEFDSEISKGVFDLEHFLVKNQFKKKLLRLKELNQGEEDKDLFDEIDSLTKTK